MAALDAFEVLFVKTPQCVKHKGGGVRDMNRATNTNGAHVNICKYPMA